jgi:hypothetical protein
MIDKDVFLNFAKFNFYHFQHRWLGLILFPLFLTLFAYFNLITGSTTLFFLFLAIGFIVPLGSIAIFRSNLKNQIKANNLEIPRLAYSVLCNSSGIVVSTDSQHANYPWSRIFRIYRTKKYLYIYVTKSKVFILPFEGLSQGTEKDLIDFTTGFLESGKFFQTKF